MVLSDTLKPGASLILRDHDAHNQKMWRLVALAQDVLNRGTLESWVYNGQERRQCYSPGWARNPMMAGCGLNSSGNGLLQQGAPTLNRLIRYRRA